MAGLEVRIEDAERTSERLTLAEECLASADLYTREAGAQTLAGLTAPDALRLLEKACSDRDLRVREGGLRALLASVVAAEDSPEVEAALLRVLARSGSISSIRDNLAAGKQECTGALSPSGYDVRRFRFLAANPDLARSRLKSIETGLHRQVQAFRSARLRANPSFLALFDVIRADPDLPRPLKALLARRMEFLERGGEPRSLEPFWEDIRRMTALLAGFGSDRTLTALCELAIDRTVTRESASLWKRLQAEIPYVPELVIGAGSHAANFCSALSVLRPDCLPLVVEQRERLGGQFAAPEGAAWLLNSRSRPAGEDRRSAPGTGQMLNAIGAYAPVQEADLTGQSYASQDRLALATRLSLFLSCQALIGTTFVERFPNNARTREKLGLSATTVPSGRYLVAVEQVESGERKYLATDALIFAGGLGEANIAFRDRTSRQKAQEEREKARAGQSAHYLPFEDFMARLVDAKNPFPLRGLNRVIVIGDGDSARVSIEALLGYGPPAGNTIHTLDRVREVVWIGQKAVTREQFLNCERPRYHALSVEFPREKGRASSARIRPVAERAAGFAIEGGQAIVSTMEGGKYSGDLVLDCTGFSNPLRHAPEPLASFTGPFKEGSKLRLGDGIGVEPDIVLTCRSVTAPEPDSSLRQIEGVAQQVIVRSPLSAEIPFATLLCEPEEIGAELERAVRKCFALEESTRLYIKKSVLPVVYTMINGERKPIARQEREERVYYLGPQAGLPPPREFSQDIAEERRNAVALWRYAGEVTAFAEYYFANFARRAEANAFTPGREVQELPRTRQKKAGEEVRVVAPLGFDSREEIALPQNIETRHLLHYLLWEQLRRFRLPETTTDHTLVLQLTPLPKQTNLEAGLEVRANLPSIEDRSLLPLLQAMASEPLLQQTLFHLGFPTRAAWVRGRATPLTATLCVRGGRFHLRSLWQEENTGKNTDERRDVTETAGDRTDGD